ncbi:alpha/beta-hydrolase [Conidiobolus coronatus NRRL 28638]|uniref:Alpha/beta-hydrolase n=1 Tax=Conidiobolus coronatus (strain ATCC 28846 / CBS 209.66 / NRRL 28638) TaxID=796925 RepID=A0A137NV21_CONC2|nr:alpha/beta-hydrolase [Conidiobolus coronatus NRRL 28638]|eukprot:KXN66511.1 alpha/beta-hydrolase [Conidiobolus coronatus NRRL 28638]
MKINAATQVKNSKTELVKIQDKFRQRAHELVKAHLKEVYGDDEWYGPESHWSKSHPLESEWVIPNHLTRSSNSNVILYIHGGAYIMGHFSQYRSALEILAQNTDSIVLGASYRLAPDYSAPCQLEDALAHILYLTSPIEDSGIGLSFDQIAVSGDSAGGGLSSTLNHFMRDAKIGKLAGAILYSPWIDLTTGQPSCTGCTDTCLLQSIENPTYERDNDGNLLPGIFKTSFECSAFEIQNKMIERGHFFAPKKYINSPLVSSLCDNNFKDLPPALIISGEGEAFRDEDYLYHELINNSYSEEELSEFKIPPTTLHFYEEMFHIFPMILPELEPSLESVKRASNFIKQCFAQKSDDFNSVQANNPINLGIDNNASNLTASSQSRNLYLSTVKDHFLIPFSPNYRTATIPTWNSSN